MSSLFNNISGQLQPIMGGNSQLLMGGYGGTPEDDYGNLRAQPVPGQSTPGMGGKAGGSKPNPFSQVPVDMEGNLLQPGANDNLPQTPPMMTPQTGTPGRPVSVADFTPRGPGLANPGGGGVVQNPSPQVPGQSTPGVGGKTGGGVFQPFMGPAPTINPIARGGGRAQMQSTKPRGMVGKGAGRGGILR